MDSLVVRNTLKFDYDDHAWCLLVGFQMGRLEFLFNNKKFDRKTNELLEKKQAELIEEIRSVLKIKGIVLKDNFDEYQSMNRDIMREIEVLGGRYLSFYMIGMCAIRVSLLEAAKKENKEELTRIAQSCIYSIPSQFLKDKDLLFQHLLEKRFSSIVELADFLYSLNGFNFDEVKQQTSYGAQIFISYASEDRDAVTLIYKQLIKSGFNPWLDVMKLKGGQDWRLEIEKAIEESALVLVCLSHHSTTKRGYVQKEIVKVLDVVDLMPEDRVYIIPVRLEECNVPRRLSRWQWIDLFLPDGSQRLDDAIRAAVKSA